MSPEELDASESTRWKFVAMELERTLLSVLQDAERLASKHRFNVRDD